VPHSSRARATEAPRAARAADVGLARIMDTSHLATGVAPCGTFAYAAPELLMGTRCDEKARPPLGAAAPADRRRPALLL